MMEGGPEPSHPVSTRDSAATAANGGQDTTGVPPSVSPSSLPLSSPRPRSASSGGNGRGARGARGPGMRLQSLADLATQVSSRCSCCCGCVVIVF